MKRLSSCISKHECAMNMEFVTCWRDMPPVVDDVTIALPTNHLLTWLHRYTCMYSVYH